MLARGGRNQVHLPAAVVRGGTWVIVVLLGVGVLMNVASSSPWERYGWGPFTLVLFRLECRPRPRWRARPTGMTPQSQ